MRAKEYFIVLSLILLVISGIDGQQVPYEQRVDCEPEGQADLNKCIQRGCIYDEVSYINIDS